MKSNLSVELKGFTGALLVSLLLSLIAAPIIYYSGLRETLLAPLGKLILIISIFFGGSYVSKIYGTKGLIRGATIGTMFFILIFILTLVINPSLICFKNIIYTLLICLVSGSLGGILGIGLSQN